MAALPDSGSLTDAFSTAQRIGKELDKLVPEGSLFKYEIVNQFGKAEIRTNIPLHDQWKTPATYEVGVSRVKLKGFSDIIALSYAQPDDTDNVKRGGNDFVVREAARVIAEDAAKAGLFNPPKP